jgi:CBS domain-containing protein
MKVSELMTTDVATTTPAATLKEVAHMLVERGISGMPVCDDEGAVVGVISEGDILYKARGPVERPGGTLGWLFDATPEWEHEKAEARTAGEAMSAPAVTIAPIESVAAAARMMTESGVNRLPVVSFDGRLVGIVTRADLVRAFVRSDRVIAAEIREEVLERALWLTPGTIEVAVRDGAVELTGELETEADVHVLELLVARVPGVVAVQSQVTARPPRKQARAWHSTVGW